MSARRAASGSPPRATSSASGSRCRSWVRRSVSRRRRSTRPRRSMSSIICTTLAPLTPSDPASSACGTGPSAVRAARHAQVAGLDPQRLERGREVAVHPGVHPGDEEAPRSPAAARGSSGESSPSPRPEQQLAELLVLGDREDRRSARRRGPRRAGASAERRPRPRACGSARRSAGRRGCAPASTRPWAARSAATFTTVVRLVPIVSAIDCWVRVTPPARESRAAYACTSTPGGSVSPSAA